MQNDSSAVLEVAQVPANAPEVNLPAPHSKSTNWFPSLHHSPSTSMTVNTRAAMNIIQQMWESPLSQGKFCTKTSLILRFSSNLDDYILF